MPGNMPETDKISQSSSLTPKYRTRKTQFGNGYSQRQADGINSKIDMWSVAWENMTATQKDTIVGVLDSVGGYDYINWAPNGESTNKKFIVTDGYSISILSGDVFTITTSLEQVFDL